jgi:hypothetical protein
MQIHVLDISFASKYNNKGLNTNFYDVRKNNNEFKEYYLLGYKAVLSVEIQLTFRRNRSPPSPGSKNKPSKKSA